MSWNIALMAVSTGFKIIGQVQEGRAQQSAEAFRQADIQNQAAQAEIGALNDELERREELTRLLAAQEAAAAGLGRSIRRGTTLTAIQSDTKAKANRDISNIRLMGASNQRGFRLGVEQSQLASKTAKKSSLLGAGMSLLTGASDINDVIPR